MKAKNTKNAKVKVLFLYKKKEYNKIRRGNAAARTLLASGVLPLRKQAPADTCPKQTKTVSVQALENQYMYM